MDKARAATVLLVEDNPDHAMLAMKAFKKGNLRAEVFWVKDGQEALDFLAASYGAGANSYVTKPVSAKIFIDHLESLKLYWLFTNAPPAA